MRLCRARRSRFVAFDVFDVSSPANLQRVGGYRFQGGEASTWAVAVSETTPMRRIREPRTSLM
jgi:hypothetical protein